MVGMRVSLGFVSMGFFRVSIGFFKGFLEGSLFRVSSVIFKVSFRVSLGLLIEFLLGFLFFFSGFLLDFFEGFFGVSLVEVLQGIMHPYSASQCHPLHP